MQPTTSDDALRQLADAFGVATDYWDWQGRHVDVPRSTLLAVLASLGVDAADPEAAAAALATRRSRTRMLPPYAVARTGPGTSTVEVTVLRHAEVDVWLTLEDGTHHSDLVPNDEWVSADGGARTLTFVVPGDLPVGYHAVHAYSGGTQEHCVLITSPGWLGLPERLGEHKAWGLATQLYSVRSRRSWGVGDLTDLGQLATWAGAEHGADFVLVNPLHAAEPVAPMNPSPYLPTTRRFGNPLYIRVEQVPEYAYLSAPDRAKVDALRAGLPAADQDRIDRDAPWAAKRAALQVIHAAGLDAGRAIAYADFRRRQGSALDDFAVWSAVTEVHGPDWTAWPADLRHPRLPAVGAFAAQHADAVELYRWLQWVLDEQLADAQATARRSGMRLGVVHDLAVGVSAVGADSWAWQDEIATGITVGAPPDAYAQTGQDWRQPPWRPDRLADLAYAPFRDLVANALRHSGGLRVDHIIGLFRLWWIPAGAAPTAGTYVRYDHDALVGILALEAARAGAVVIGEDLGTVEPWVRDYLRERGLLGTSILWFEFDWDGGGGPLAPERWREYCLASVTTHDLPPTAGYLAGDHVRLRDRLGLLTRSLADELDADQADKDAWLAELRRRGLLADDADVEETVVALHRALAATPARLRTLALTDAVGDRRTQNQPGTLDEYPNWRVPLTGPDGRPVGLEDVFSNPRAAALAETMRQP